MLGRNAVAILTVFLAFGVAGCLDASTPKAALMEGDGHDHMRQVGGTFHMEGADCEEAGWIAHYSGSPTFAGVWKAADIREEYGNPIQDSIGAPTPLLNPLYGNHHIGFNCKTAVVNGEAIENYKWGFVGEQIEAPSWDPGGAERHILIGGMSFENGTIADALRATTTADFTHTLTSYTTWTIPRDQPRAFAYSEYHDWEKGLYQTWSNLEHLRDLPERTVRFWWQVPADGSDAEIWGPAHDHDGEDQPEDMKWNPVYWDMKTGGGGHWVSPKDRVGAQEHNFGLLPTAAGGTAEHYPPFSQPCLATFYEHKTVTFTSGKVFPDVLIDELWAH